MKNNDDYKEISREQLAVIVIFSLIISVVLGLGFFGISWIVIPFVILSTSVATGSVCYIVLLINGMFK